MPQRAADGEIDTAEAARRVGITPRSLRAHVERGTLPARGTTRGYRYRPADVEAFRLRREAARCAERSLRPRTLSTAQAARLLGITRNAVYYHIRRGSLAAVTMPFGHRFDPADVEAFRQHRERHVALYGDLRVGVAGAPRGHLSRVKHGQRIRRLDRALRGLPPRTRQAVQTAVAAEVLRRAAAAPTPAARHRARIRAAMDVLEAYRCAVDVPAGTELERHIRVLRAMTPFLRAP